MSHLSAQTQSVWWVAGVNCGTTQTIWDFWSISIHSLVSRSLWRQKQESRERWNTVGSIANNLFSEWVSYSSFILQIVFFVSLIFSAITVFTELTTLLYWVTNKYFSPFRWAYSLSLSFTSNSPWDTESCVHVDSSMRTRYISVCFFYSYFNFPVPFISSFDLYPHHTDVFALAQNAINLCRFQFSLFYHYFTLLQVIVYFTHYR